MDALSGRYTIDRQLGRGGMATVYLARDLKHNRPVALKVLHPELAAIVGPERFLREIQIAANLNHPHILPLHDSGEAAGQLWYTMPYVEGESLRDRLTREKQLPLEDTLRLGRQVAQALDYAHRRGVVHRDIKPENILLEEGQAVVADFGIAHAISDAGGTRLTATGLTVGTPTYMSPEQAAGERSLDGRSDLYSLGCVLYEMLAGEPPFTGPTAQVILAKRLHDPVPSLRVVRDTVPAGVERTIEKALAKVPADRFATAAEFAQALSLSPRARDGAGGEAKWRRRIFPAAALALVAVIGTVIVRSRPSTPPTLDPDLIAVAPFEVVAPELRPWSEGLVDVLSRSLDGAGPLRTVAPTVALRRWTGRADPAAASALGRRTGAGLVVFGSLDRSGSDSIRVRAALLAVGAKDAPLEVEVRGDTLRMDRLFDSLAVALLRELGRTRPVGAVRQSPLGAKSLPALKAFLQGEQFYRRGLWDPALSHYDRAIALDSGFALAHRRMGWVIGWGSPGVVPYKSGDEYVRHAAALNHGLAPRDSLLIVGDTLFLATGEADWEVPDAQYFANRRRLFATLAEAQRRYPGDPEVWYALGEALYHNQNPAVATEEETLDAFDRAIALDSAFAPAYFHVPGLAIATDLGDPARARRYLTMYRRLNRSDVNSSPLRLTERLLEPQLADLPETARLIDTGYAGVLFDAGFMQLSEWPDSAETAVRVLRSLAFGRHNYTGFPSWIRDSLARRRMLASALVQRGHLHEAYQLDPVFEGASPGPSQDQYVRLALLGAVPVDTAAVAFRRMLERDPPAVIALAPVLPWWLKQRDTIALARFGLRVDSLARHDSAKPLANVVRHYIADAARAYLTLARGDSAAALRAFASLPDSVCGLWWISCRAQKVTEARLLGAVGEDRRAMELLEQWGGLEPLAVLERARLAERLGERDKAIKSYQFVADAWRHADPELRTYVMEARGGLERLTGEPRRKARDSATVG
jgi:eukaryotic-like serine/threonine-protein kinase